MERARAAIFHYFLGASIFVRALWENASPERNIWESSLSASNLGCSEHAAHGIVCPVLPASSTCCRQYHPPHASTSALQNSSYSKTVLLKDFDARRYFLLQFYTGDEFPSETFLQGTICLGHDFVSVSDIVFRHINQKNKTVFLCH